MKNTIVVFYSRTGSNRYLAQKISESLECKMVAIKPRINSHLLFLMGINPGIEKLPVSLTIFDRVILCGPIWIGKFVTPLKAFVKKHGKDINELVFATCCGSSDEIKDKKYGHGLVFNEIKATLQDKCIHCEAFPIPLVLPEDKKKDDQAVMNTRLSNANFKGEIEERFERFVERLRQR